MKTFVKQTKLIRQSGENSLSLLPSNYKVVFLGMDKGYFGENTFEYLEKKEIRYIAADKNTEPLRKIASSLTEVSPITLFSYLLH